jgi:hypothetical protein
MDIAISAREMALSIYREWFNNFLTVEVFADHHGLEPEHAEALLQACRLIANTPHPDM